MTDAEKLYDTQIAPKLLELQQACEARGMSFIAQVEYAHGETGETCKVMPGASIKPYTAYWGVKCRGNVDSFNIAAAKHAREFGHSSMVLHMLGITVSVKP